MAGHPMNRNAKNWVKHINTFLRAQRRPVAEWEIADYLKTWGLPIPNLEFIDWMVKKGMIDRHLFKNRNSTYYSNACNVTYDFINDAPPIGRDGLIVFESENSSTVPKTPASLLMSSITKSKPSTGIPTSSNTCLAKKDLEAVLADMDSYVSGGFPPPSNNELQVQLLAMREQMRILEAKVNDLLEAAEGKLKEQKTPRKTVKGKSK